MKTKFSKSFTTISFPVGEEVGEIVAEWVRYLKDEKLWGNDDPLFPATRSRGWASRASLNRADWTGSTGARLRRSATIFREAFERAGLPYFNPHSLRKTLGRLGEQLCKSPEEFKAWSQNLGHEKVLTTLTELWNCADGHGRARLSANWPRRRSTSTAGDDAHSPGFGRRASQIRHGDSRTRRMIPTALLLRNGALLRPPSS